MLNQKLTKFMDGFTETDDWTFLKADTRYLTHGLHPYPARMIPQVARKLIDMYSKNSKDVCIDPYCGSGTVLVESKLNGIRSIGVDLNPLAVLISKVKTTAISRDLLSAERRVIFRKIENDNVKSKNIKIPQIKNLDYWFKPEVSRLLTIIKDKIDEIENEDISNFFKVCFSLTVRKVSNTRSGEFKLFRIPKEILKSYNPNVIQTFFQTLDANIHRMNEFCGINSSNRISSSVIKGDTRKLTEIDPQTIHEDCATILVTSPPYGDAHTTVAYGQFSRYPSAWLGFEEEEVWKVDKNGLGGKVFKKFEDLESPTLEATLELIKKTDNHRAKEAYAFFKDIDKSLEQISMVMKDSRSHICFVLGNRTVTRVRIPADTILVELAKKYGFKHLITYHRDIPNKHMPSVNAPENISSLRGETMSKENILVWEF